MDGGLGPGFDLGPCSGLITVTDLRGAFRSRSPLPEGTRWVFLGKNVQARLELACRWGTPPAGIGRQLQEKARALRQPMLDLVARIGLHPYDPLTWWSTRFSWKMAGASDFFLLACYQAVALELAESSRREKSPLLLVVEDPWLLRQIAAHLREQRFEARVRVGRPLALTQIHCVAAGALRRVKWLAVTLWAWAQQKGLWPREEVASSAGPTAAIYSPPQARSLPDTGEWLDPYLPPLHDLLRQAGYRVLRFCFPEHSGFEQALADRAAYARPLILYATPGGILRSLLAFWKPQWPASLQLEGMPVDLLCRREGWQEIGQAGLCSYRLFYECFSRFLKKEGVGLVVTFFENQPWEKLAAVAARRNGTRLVGIQTSLFSRYMLSYPLGSGEADRMPLPDVICTSGPAAQKLLIEGSHSPERLRMCGSVRYRHLHRDNGSQKLPPASRREILVILSIDRTLSLHLLSATRRAFPDGGRFMGLGFNVRPHPLCPIQQADVGFPARINDNPRSPLEEDLRRCGMVLFVNSTAGLEALAHGRPALRFRSEWLLDVDEWCGPDVLVCTEETLRDSLMALVQNSRAGLESAVLESIVSQYLAPLHEDLLKKILTAETPSCCYGKINGFQRRRGGFA